MIKSYLTKLLKLWGIAIVTFVIGLWPIALIALGYSLYIAIKYILFIADKADERIKKKK